MRTTRPPEPEVALGGEEGQIYDHHPHEARCDSPVFAPACLRAMTPATAAIVSQSFNIFKEHSLDACFVCERQAGQNNSS